MINSAFFEVSELSYDIFLKDTPNSPVCWQNKIQWNLLYKWRDYLAIMVVLVSKHRILRTVFRLKKNKTTHAPLIPKKKNPHPIISEKFYLETI